MTLAQVPEIPHTGGGRELGALGEVGLKGVACDVLGEAPGPQGIDGQVELRRRTAAWKHRTLSIRDCMDATYHKQI